MKVSATPWGNRLFNWKFNQARSSMPDGLDEELVEMVDALQQTFGDSGWFGGNMGMIVELAVSKLLDWDLDD